MTDIQRLWILLFCLTLLLLFYLLQPILTPFLVAALLAYLGDPLADRLEARGLSRTMSVVLVFFGLSLIAVLLILLSIPLVTTQLDLLATKIPQWLTVIQQKGIPWLQDRLGVSLEAIPLSEVKSMLSENMGTTGDVIKKVWSSVAGSSLALIAWLANLVLIPVVAFYLLRDWDVLMTNISDFLPRSVEAKISELAKECDEIIGAFIRGQLLVMLTLGGVYSLGLWMLGLDLAFILGLIAGLASIVPYMGFIVGIVAAGLAAWFQFYELLPLLGVAGVFAVGQALEGMVLTPLLVGDRIGLHPVAVIFAIMAGGQLAGFTGVLLALPAAAVIMVIVRHLHRSYKGSALYTTEK